MRSMAALLEAGFVAMVGHGLFTRTLLWVALVAPDAVDAQHMRAYRFIAGFRNLNASISKVYRNSARAAVRRSRRGAPAA
ncbi:MAG: hypothetical protein U0Z44_02895 [Kouleothrix sp.]